MATTASTINLLPFGIFCLGGSTLMVVGTCSGGCCNSGCGHNTMVIKASQFRSTPKLVLGLQSIRHYQFIGLPPDDCW
jgi:hypothetical protein